MASPAEEHRIAPCVIMGSHSVSCRLTAALNGESMFGGSPTFNVNKTIPDQSLARHFDSNPGSQFLIFQCIVTLS